MAEIIKHAHEEKSYDIEFSDLADDDGISLAESSVTITDQFGNDQSSTMIEGVTDQGKKLYFRLQAGTPGVEYDLVAKIRSTKNVTDDATGIKDQRNIKVKVLK